MVILTYKPISIEDVLSGLILHCKRCFFLHSNSTFRLVEGLTKNDGVKYLSLLCLFSTIHRFYCINQDTDGHTDRFARDVTSLSRKVSLVIASRLSTR